jgi:uncharacterized membrane protein YbhN (UPF0104 family)
LFGVALWLIDFAAFGSVLMSIRPTWLVTAVGAWVLYQIASAWLASMLVGRQVPVAKIWRVNLISTYFGLFLPGDAVAGLVSRLRYLGLASWQEVALLTLAERLMALGVMSALAALAYPFSAIAANLGPVALVVPLLAAAAATLGIAMLKSNRLRTLAARFLSRLGGLSTTTFSPTVSFRAVAAAASVALLSGLVTWLVLQALSARVGLVDAFVFSYLATLLQLVPLFFAGIGVRDLSAIAILGVIGVSQETAFACSTVGLLLLVVSALVGGALQIREERARAFGTRLGR